MIANNHQLNCYPFSVYFYYVSLSDIHVLLRYFIVATYTDHIVFVKVIDFFYLSIVGHSFKTFCYIHIPQIVTLVSS